MFNDLMENIEWFFNLHDKNKDGYLTKDEVLTLSESLLVGITQIPVDFVLTIVIPVHFPLRGRRRLLRSCQSLHVERLRVR